MDFFSKKKVDFFGNSQHLYAVCFQRINYAIFNKIIPNQNSSLAAVIVSLFKMVYKILVKRKIV